MERDWDVIIVGAGTAGMPVAIHAEHRGARVLVIEHADRIGGTLHVSGGQMAAAGTRAQADQGIDDLERTAGHQVLHPGHARDLPHYMRSHTN